MINISVLIKIKNDLFCKTWIQVKKNSPQRPHMVLSSPPPGIFISALTQTHGKMHCGPWVMSSSTENMYGSK